MKALPSMQSQVPASCRQQPPPPSDFVLESGAAASVPFAAIAAICSCILIVQLIGNEVRVGKAEKGRAQK